MWYEVWGGIKYVLSCSSKMELLSIEVSYHNNKFHLNYYESVDIVVGG